MDLNLKGKRAIVCGSTQGIGKAIAFELAQLGANITLVARNENRLIEVLEELPYNQGQKHHYICVDFVDTDRLKTVIDQYLIKVNQAEILINNTGGPAGGPIADASLDEFQKAFNQHLICNHILAQAVIPYMKRVEYGRIINIISTSVKSPLNGLGVSNTVRGAVANWAKTMANESGGHGMTVNNVLPGATQTGRLTSIIENKSKKSGLSKKEVEKNMLSSIPANRFAQPEEVAGTAAFLASPAGSYINGINIPVDGGRLSCL